MGAALSEWVVETILRDGLNELRLNPDRLDDLFGVFTNTYFNNQYGQAKIDEIKTYIVNNQIKITHALNLAPSDFPCFSISLQEANEEEDLQQFSNLGEELDESTTPTVIVPVVTPISYDRPTGKLVVNPSADLSMVRPGLVFVDAFGTKFTIGSGNSNLAGNKYINIGANENPDMSGSGRIESGIAIKRSDIRTIRLRETILLGCHATNNLHLAKYMFYILLYILKSKQEVLETRGIHLDSNIGQVFNREAEFEGEHVFSRSIQLRCITEFSWNQGEVSLIDCFDINLKGSSKEEDGEVIVDPINRNK